MNLLSMSVASVALALVLMSDRLRAESAGSQEPQSAAKAAGLTKLLDERKLDAMAVADPAEPGRFAAALYYPGAQLLVVTAVHPAPDALAQRLSERKYRDVYLDLQSPSTQKGRFFVLDVGANGLQQQPKGAAVDQTYRDGANRISYDGDRDSQKRNEANYNNRYRRDDEQYARVLALLSEELARTPSTAR